jgi:hypothetical protein
MISKIIISSSLVSVINNGIVITPLRLLQKQGRDYSMFPLFTSGDTKRDNSILSKLINGRITFEEAMYIIKPVINPDFVL